jgi:small subunit ribosomal protein S10e
LVPKKNRLAVYSYLFKEGVAVAPKTFALGKNPHIEVPNVQVVKLMQSLESRGFVREKFSWMWHYYFLTNEGIEYLREYLHVSEDTVPATHKKSNKPQPPPSFGSFGGDRGKGKGKGGFKGSGGGFKGGKGKGDRDDYRGPSDKDGGAPAGYRPEFGSSEGKGRGGFKGGGFGRGGASAGRGGGRGGF